LRDRLTTRPGAGRSPAADEKVETTPPAKGWRTVPRRARAATDGHAMGTTTVTLKNIPKKCSRDQLVAKLEEMDFSGQLGLVFMQVDISKKCGTGQAVISFRSVEACERFTQLFHKASTKLIAASPAGSKLLEVAPAPVQGVEANLVKLQSSALLMDLLSGMPQWLPQLFDEQGKPTEFSGDVEGQARPES